MTKTSKRGRDAKTGRFVSIKEAERRPATTIIETISVGPTKKQKHPAKKKKKK